MAGTNAKWELNMRNKIFWRAKKNTQFKFIEATGDDHLDMDFYDAFFYRNSVGYDRPVYPDLDRLAYTWQKKSKSKKPDIIWNPALLSLFFCNPETSEKLSNVLRPGCDCWKVPCDAETLDMHIVANEIDALDYKRSSYEIDPDFKEITRIKKYVFKKGFETDLDIFRLKGEGASLRTSVIVSDRFRNTYEKLNLTGMEFFPVECTASFW